MSERPNASDTFLARRFNFLGFPSERHGGKLSYANLCSELGDENAAALVNSIGKLVTRRAPEKPSEPLHHTVDRLVQALVSDERRAVAQDAIVSASEIADV